MRKNRTARAAAGGHSHLRTEMDSLGAVGVPADHLWGAQTQRCLADFQIGLDRFRWGRPVIRALGIVKKCAALANQETGCLVAKSVEYQGVVMMGRTHLQDAIPITLGQIASGWAAQLDRAIRDVRQTLTGLYELAVGATAVGTGLNAPADFAEAAARLIAAETGRPIVSAANKFAATSAHDAMVATSGSLRTLAGALMKIANDIRWYASGPAPGSANCFSRKTSRALPSCRARSNPRNAKP